MTASVELRLTGNMDHLRLVWQTGETLLDSIPFQEDPEGTRYNVLLALQEMVTNVLRHAYAGDESKPLEVKFTANGEGFAAELKDRGPEFDPLAVETAAAGSSEEASMPVKEGGYGIMITKMVMDSMEYERQHGWNVLRMHKSVRTPVAGQAR